MMTQIRNPQSPQYEAPFPSITSPLRGLGSSIQSSSSTPSDVRASLQRRFTTNVLPTAVGTLSAIGQQRRQAAESMDSTFWTNQRIPLHIKKQQDIETARASRENFQAASRDNFQTAMAAVAQLDPAEKVEILRRMELSTQYSLAPGHQSEPTTPPEYRESGFPSVLSRPNRYSSASIVSPPGLTNRPSRSGSQMTSPPADLNRMFSPIAHISSNISHVPSKSMPGSRRNSDEEEDEYSEEVEDFTHRSQNRISMPITASDLRGRADMSDLASVLGHVNTTKFLFDDEDETPSRTRQHLLTSPEVKSYLHMKTTEDNFPMLVSSGQSGPVNSQAQSALDLASSQAAGHRQSNAWPPFRGHRAAPSLPADAFSLSSIGKSSGPLKDPALKASAGNRRSLEVKFDALSEYKRPNLLRDPQNGVPKLQSSYSTNDIPTLKKANGISGSLLSGNVTPKSQAEQRLHSHNASLGRVPPDALGNHHGRELSTVGPRVENAISAPHLLQSALQGSATPFGPNSGTTALSQVSTNVVTSPSMPSIHDQAYYGGYGMQMLNMGMGNLVLGSQPQWNGAMQQVYPGAYGSYSPYQQYGPGQGGVADSQARIAQQRRLQNGEDARFANTPLESLKGEIYGLCKDQHGCRFLQKKLEDRNPENIELIFSEVKDHVVELMTDPFGNYLIQKLLECANESQRTVLIENAASHMVQIALNQHGTRALQKMIDFISTREQIQTIIFALKDKVVQLIQDLNGNHVIQKCLNRLSPEDAQFIFDAVGAHCVVVGTHRHGCCVLQRCIDHASGYQKAQLIEQITANAFALVQDPFGNYVVQYILDLGEPAFSTPLCASFLGSISALSRQKFSSNVIEKCIRTADTDTKRKMIDELINPVELERLLRDSFANYVVQTAMDYADPDTKSRLIENVRPILPAIRQTPYGRRIQGKIQDRDGRHSNMSSGQITPHDSSMPGQLQVGNPSAQTHQRTNVSYPPSVLGTTSNGTANPGNSLYNITSPVSSAATPRYGHQNMAPYFQGLNPVQQPFSAYGRASQHSWTTANPAAMRDSMNYY